VTTSGSAATRAWGGNGFTATSSSAAITAGDYVTCALTAAAGYQMSLGSVSQFSYRRSNSSGPPNGLLQYQVGSGSFTDITTLAFASGSSGNSLNAIDLSGISALQGVPAGTPVTFRVALYGASSSTGNWYIYDVAASSAADFAISGSVLAAAPPTPAAPPSLGSSGFTGNQFHFVVSGTAGSNYVVQVNTNLAGNSWTPVATNSAPFTFTESNANSFIQRFYRARVAP
jgi:hypothetical protein